MRFSEVLKRIIDCIVSSAFLLALSPIFIGIALAIRLFSPGPIFYCGKRVGLNGRLFRVFKFRSMVIDAEELGGSATPEDDPRLTRVGAWLRRYKVDELPQLVNVLVGDMSLVGPRPEVQKYVQLYSREERRILQLRPGITDWASLWNFNEGAVLAGSEDPEKAYERVIRPTKLHLQLSYVSNHSLAVDIQILFHTAMKLMLRDRWVPTVIKPYTRPCNTDRPGADGIDSKELGFRPAAAQAGENDCQSTGVTYVPRKKSAVRGR